MNETKSEIPTFQESRDEHDRAYFTRVLKMADGERQRAAQLAGVNRTHLQKLISKLAIDIPMNPRARARSKCSRCTEKTDSKGGKIIDGKFVCASCVTVGDTSSEQKETNHEARQTQAASGGIRF